MSELDTNHLRNMALACGARGITPETAAGLMEQAATEIDRLRGAARSHEALNNVAPQVPGNGVTDRADARPAGAAPTPRTDAFYEEWGEISPNFARQLERELNAWQIGAHAEQDRAIRCEEAKIGTAPSSTRRTDLADELEALDRAATPAPWAWDQRGEKINEWGMGVALKVDETPIAGRFTDEDVDYVEYVCSHEAATCNYNDPALIAYMRNNLPAIIAALRSVAASAIAAPQWIPVGERKPTANDGRVAVLISDTNVAIENLETVAHVDLQGNWWAGVPGDYLPLTENRWEVTHWMRLPKLAATDGGAKP